MKTEQQLKELILERAKVLQGSCNSFYTNHVQGQIRGLLWALYGEDKGYPSDTDELGDLLGVKLDDHCNIISGSLNPNKKTDEGFGRQD